MTTIAPMTPAHLNAVHAIECDTFSDPWPKEDILDEINRADSLCLVAHSHGQLAGFATARHIIDEVHICNIAVSEPHRKKGIGSALLDHLIAIAQARNLAALTLEVRIGNRAAMALYHKHGFKVEGYRKGYYSDPTEDAAIMWKYI